MTMAMNASALAPDDGRADSAAERSSAPLALTGGIVGCAAVRPLVVLPTYNEAENIADVLERVRAAVPDADVLVVDDGSPDGTADLAEELAGASSAASTVLRRAEKAGLGSAYRAGFAWGSTRLRRADRDGLRPASTIRRRCPRCGRGRRRRRPRHRVALRARRVDPGLASGTAALLSRWAATATPARARPAGARRHRRVPRLPRDRRSSDRPRRGQGRRLRLPDRDGLRRRRAPAVASSRCRSRSATACGALEDVEPHRGRGARPRHVVGDPRSAAARGEPATGA